MLITHSSAIFGVTLLNGDMAVTCFYIISGFLITLILREKYTTETGAFYLNRGLRIYVPYWAALVFAIVVFSIINDPHQDPTSTYDAAKAAGSYPYIIWSMISNVTLFGIDLTRYIQVNSDLGISWPNFLHADGGGGEGLLFVPQAWTLGVELQFYLLAPFVVRKLRASWLLLLTAVLFVITISEYEHLRQAQVPIDTSSIFAFQLEYFLLGALAYHGYTYLRDWSVPERAKLTAGAVVWLFAILMIWRGTPTFHTAEFRTIQWFYLAFAASLPFVFYLTKDWRWDHRVGDYSYPIYIFHYSIAAILVGQTSVPAGWLVLLLTVVVCTIFLVLIDQPLQRLRRRIARRSGAVGPEALGEPIGEHEEEPEPAGPWWRALLPGSR